MEDLAEQLLQKYSRKQISALINLLEPQAPTGSMTAVEFGKLLDKLQRKKNAYSAKSVAIARLHWVEGASIGEAARECGVSYQCSYSLINRIKKNFL
ncbi:MAG: hypothetical protein RBR82_18275 [Pseudomonas sp.]|nr:hypothetical protein [Pseudomonas sp.]